MKTISRLYFTRQSLLQLKELKHNQPDHYYLIKHHQLPLLCRYPLQGRLLLNKVVDQHSHEIASLMKQFTTHFSNIEIREFCCGSESLLYLNQPSIVYLLGVIPIYSAIPGIEHYWLNH